MEVEHLKVRSVVAKVRKVAVEVVFKELKALKHHEVGQRRRNRSGELVVWQDPVVFVTRRSDDVKSFV